MNGTSATGEARHATADAGTVIRRWFDDVWNQGDEKAIDRLLAENSTMWCVNRPDVSSTGSEEFKKFYRTMRSTLGRLNSDEDPARLRCRKSSVAFDTAATSASRRIAPGALRLWRMGSVANGSAPVLEARPAISRRRAIVSLLSLSA